jgi:hypothetical protein
LAPAADLLADVDQASAGFAVVFGGERLQVVRDAEQEPQDFEVDVHRVEQRRSLAGVSCAGRAFQHLQCLPLKLCPDLEPQVAGKLADLVDQPHDKLMRRADHRQFFSDAADPR